jgi:hypothetical protein
MESLFRSSATPLVVVVILQEVVDVFSKPKGGELCSQLRYGVYVPCLEKSCVDGTNWVHTPSGWIRPFNIDHLPNYEEIEDVQFALDSWQTEESKKKRMGSAIACELVKSHPLKKATRFVNSLVKHAEKHYPEKPMIKIRQIGMEDIMISLGGKMGLTKQQIFSYIKVTASQMSNPSQAVIDIVTEVSRLIKFRPTQWVSYDLNVLETEDVKRRNDHFVMFAASGKLKEFKEMVEKGHELTCLHSELKYTALHSAADFGQVAVVEYIITTGVSLNMRDPRRLQTALHLAGYNGREGVIRVLLAAHANRKLSDVNEIYPYQYAQKQGHFECGEMLKFISPGPQNLQVQSHFSCSRLSMLVL